MGDDELDPNATASNTLADAFTSTNRAEESALSSWAGPYVTDMLGRGQALAQTPYTQYGGPLTAGESTLQSQAYGGLGSLYAPTTQMGAYAPTSFTEAGVAQNYMSPYMQMAVEPQIAEAQRQAEIKRVQQASRLGKAGAYGGGRQAIMESELDRNLLRNVADIYGTGVEKAYTQGMGQFNKEETARKQAQEMLNTYGFDVFAAQRRAGAEQRGIESEGIAADYAQFKEERDYPYKQLQYQQSLLEGLPVGVQSYEYSEPSGLSSLLAGAQGGTDIYTLLNNIFSGGNTDTGSAGGYTGPNLTQAQAQAMQNQYQVNLTTMAPKEAMEAAMRQFGFVI
jgi:hypothetical protein